jgi:hypothetical protein
MTNYKEIFAKHGYSLFEKDSVEAAIVDALKEGNIRYLYGIPVLLENTKINYELLIKLSKKSGVWKELRDIFFIASKIIKNKKLAKKLATLSKIKRPRLNIKEFKQSYEDHYLAQSYTGFSAALNYQLSFLFAKKQIQILYKVKKREKLSKTEKEYFSRVIKKKLMAIRAVFPLTKELFAKE